VRVLMLSQFYPPIQGGEEQSARSLSRELAARGHTVAVVTLGQEGLPEFETVDGIRIYRIHGTIQRATWLFAESGRRHAPPFPDPELIAALRGIVGREQPQIVHAHNWLGYQYLPLKLFGRARLVVSLHDMSLVCATKTFMYRNVPCSGPGVSKCLECSVQHYGPAKGVVTAVSSAAMNGIQRRSVDMFLPVSHSAARGNNLVGSRFPFEVVPNFLADDVGSDASGYDAFLEQLPKDGFLLFVGGLRRIKGIEVLLAAYQQIQNPPPLVLIGYDCLDTPETWPASVVVLKNWPHGAVMQAWRRSLMGLVPSICQETFGLVALEAMASGKPVIASRIGGLEEVVVDGETGLLIEPDNPLQLQEAMRTLLGSAELRAAMGAAGKRRADEFRASTVVPRFERIYERLVQGQGVLSAEPPVSVNPNRA
jgi:glycosyltransferase involved in cell wall biosynthesis